MGRVEDGVKEGKARGAKGGERREKDEGGMVSDE
jgi:hypothetical protein